MIKSSIASFDYDYASFPELEESVRSVSLSKILQAIPFFSSVIHFQTPYQSRENLIDLLDKVLFIITIF